MKKSAAVALGAVIALCCSTVPAAADPTPAGGSAYSAALAYTPGGVTASADLSGAVGGLFGGLLDPIVSSITATLLPALNGLGGTIQNTLAGVVTQTGIQATTPADQVDNPAPGWPACSSAGWSSNTCYVLTSLSTPASPVVGLSAPLVRGYTDADPSAAQGNPLIGRAEVQHANLNLLGISLGDLGDVIASSTCPTHGTSKATPSASSSVAGISLLGGLIGASVADPAHGVTNVMVGGEPLTGVKNITTPGGLPATVRVEGGLLTLGITLDLNALLTGLGLSPIANLTGDLAGSNLTLVVHIGPGTTTLTDDSDQTWGLEVQAGLSGSLTLSLAGLVDVVLNVSAAAGSANDSDLLDLTLANTNCTSGATASSTVWIPAGLI